MAINSDFVAELGKHITGDIRLDVASKVLYSTDASIYQIEPLGVVVPRTQDDLQVSMELAAKYRIPTLARGAGSSLAGQAIGEALILDCSRWLDKIIDINPEERTARVEPGVVLATLNREAAKHGLQYGPDPASAERATMGGVIANNATGAHSILYGMAADHLRSADVVLSDGSLATLGEISTAGAQNYLTSPLAGDRGSDGHGRSTRYAAIANVAREIREHQQQSIREGYPRSWRNSAGYRLNYLLPWSASSPPGWTGAAYPANPRPGAINLAQLLAGSEGTLAVVRAATVDLVSKPKFSVLGIIPYSGIVEACDAVPAILEKHPSAIELIPRLILRLAQDAGADPKDFSWISGDPAALLLVEFSGDEITSVRNSVEALDGKVAVATTAAEQSTVWNLRKAGLGILDSRPQAARPQAFVEDCAVPVEKLGEFVREMLRILAAHNTEAGIYAHASAGCLHIRPILDLQSAEGVRNLRHIAEQTVSLTLRLGGSMASEHGDGVARGEWLRRTYGEDIARAMLALKRAADPEGLLSPRKMLDAPTMDSQLRYGVDYRAQTWKPGIDFGRQGGLATAIEQCNGQGVCRKDAGAMCPSFQATREEMHSTRGRANLLRALITTRTGPSGGNGRDGLGRNGLGSVAEGHRLSEGVYEALDLCLGCKACKAECPSGVDMAKLKSAFQEKYFETHRRPVRDYAMGYFHVSARILSAFGPLINAVDRVPVFHRWAARVLEISPQRPFPKFERGLPRPRGAPGKPPILLLRDPFTHFAEMIVERAAIDLLSAAGFDVRVPDSMGAGAALVSKGFLRAARDHARTLMHEMAGADPSGSLPMVVIEPSELSTLRDQYADLVPEAPKQILDQLLAARSVEQLLVQSTWFAGLRAADKDTSLGFHAHCHERAHNASTANFAGMELLRGCGYQVECLPAGCCGMAGTFGYEAEHYELSQKIGELRLLPAIRALAGQGVAATGAACRLQISQATGVTAEHPLVIASRALL